MSSLSRSGSLIRRKQEQWAKEKEEEESGWFPFGKNSPGGGCPNRKFEARDYSDVSSENTTTASTSKSGHPERTVHYDNDHSHMHDKERDRDCLEGRISDSSQTCPATDYMYPPNLVPIPQYQQGAVGAMNNPYMAYQMGGQQWPGGQPFILPYPYHIPPGAIPISLPSHVSPLDHQSDPSTTASCPLSNPMLQSMTINGNYWTTPVSYVPPVEMTSSQVGGVSFEEARPSNVAVIAPMEKRVTVVDHTVEDTGKDSSRVSSGLSWSDSQPSAREGSGRRSGPTGAEVLTREEIERQIEMRKRQEELEFRREELEMEKAEKEREEGLRREQEEKRRAEMTEEEHRRALERRERELAEALEKATKEAEVMRRARLFKHVIEGAERSPELERRLLGVDSETGDRIMNQVHQFDRQRRLEWEALDSSKEERKKEKRESEGQRARSSPAKSRALSVDSGCCGSNQSMEHDQTTHQTTHKTEYISNKPPTPSYDDRPIRPAALSSSTPSSRPTSEDNRPIRPAPSHRGSGDRASLPPTPLARRSAGRMSLRGTKGEMRDADRQRRNYGSQTDVSTVRIGSERANSNMDEPSSSSHVSRIPVLKPLPSRIPRAPVAIPPTTPNYRQYLPETKYQQQQEPTALQYINNIPDYYPKPKPRTRSNSTALEDSNPLFAPIATRSRRMRPNLDSPVNLAGTAGSLDSNDGTTSGSDTNPSPHHSPIPEIRVDCNEPKKAVDAVPLPSTPEFESKSRSRSALSSPAFYLNGGNGRQSPLCASIYARKIAEKGCNNHTEDVLSPDIRRRAEASLSRHSSMASLRGSMRDLRASVSNLSVAGAEDSPNLSRYRSMNPSYRSFNTKRISDRNKETMEKLTKMREQLRSKENFVERGVLGRHSGSNHSLARP